MHNTLRLSFHKDPITLDPQKSGDKLSSAIIFLLFKGLTRFEADHSIQCDLADSFQILNNHKKFIFHLGEHFWSDGTPITAHDFVHSWKRALSPAFPLRGTNLFYHLKNAEKAKKGHVSLDKVGVYARDDRTLEVELEYPCPYFLELTSFCSLFPVNSRTKEDSAPLICSGPFQLEQWIPGQEILLKKNSLCGALWQVHLDAIHIKIIPSEKEAFNLFEDGQLDWIGNPISPLPVSYLPALLMKKKIKPVAGMTSCWFNTLKDPFSNANLRRAFAHAIPREKLLDKLLLPNALSARRFSPSILPHPQSSVFIQDSPDLAKNLYRTALRELKTKPQKMTLTYEATDEFSRMAALLKAYWEEMFQIRIQLDPLSFKEFWHGLPQKKFQMSLVCSVSQYADPVNFLEKLEFNHVPINFSGWENAKYQALLKQYRKTMNSEKRQALVEKAESTLFREMPIAPICYYHYAYLQKPHVKNLTVSPIGVMQFDRVFLEDSQQMTAKEEFETALWAQI